ncbi:biotin-protein ligase [Pyronema omphalodes]|nr:biotin-protein ligase [Pyronema omphalodes]
MNVLVYAGNGTTVDSVRHVLLSLRRLLSPHFAVSTVTADVIIKEPWMSTCALLVIPGGADVPYTRALNGEGNRRISQYVRTGGSYLGFCAGGYYGSKQVEFEADNLKLAVIGSRELAFFPGTCRGGAFKGFEYASENGARASKIHVKKTETEEAYTFHSYYNGGGVFVDAAKFQTRGVEILATYEDPLDVDGGDGNAAVVYCKYGDGAAILTGPHPEFAGQRLHKANGGPEYGPVVDAIIADEEPRNLFLRSLLTKLNLKVPENTDAPPRLSAIHLSSQNPPDVAHLIDRLSIVTLDSKIQDGNDTFLLSSSEQPLPDVVYDETDDLNAVPKPLVYHTTSYPSCPNFSHDLFFNSLSSYRQYPGQFGTFLLYGDTVTSTNVLLDKNPDLQAHLPNGTVFAATTQIAGRGRGNNIWISPKGCMIFSLLLRHSLDLNSTAPVVCLQYLVALAIVEGIKSYCPSGKYRSMPVRLKWPNDIYAFSAVENSYVKIGGILVNSSFQRNAFNLVIGAGINTHNEAPTTSLNAIRPAGTEELLQERLLARVLVVFEEFYGAFTKAGWGAFRDRYEKEWLHQGQQVTLEMEGNAKGTVMGITDEGLLKVKMAEGGRMVELMSDGNSFDFFRGLVKTKR